jgi:hypothetical protein
MFRVSDDDDVRIKSKREGFMIRWTNDVVCGNKDFFEACYWYL